MESSKQLLMTITNPKSWARKNKRVFANKMITSAGVEAHPEPAAFFMAGLPGAGKTEFTINLIRELQLKVVRIDMDEIATHIDSYDPLQADAFREAATDTLNAVYDRALHRKVDFIMDGTFRSPNSLNNIDRAIAKGYKIKVFYISQDPTIAWSFTQAREKVEKRAIDRNSFVQAYSEIHNNIKELARRAYADLTIDLVVKESSNKVGKWHKNITLKDIDTLVNTIYTREELERMLEQ